MALVSGMAAAQSAVTVYGNIDVGVLTQNHASAGTASTTMANGGISPSIWGFRGTEDLGGGLKANFNLEGHFAPDTGAIVGNATTGNGALFRRQANVGLSSAGLGTVTLGNMYSPAILAFAATDPRGLRENFSGLYSWAYNSGVLSSTTPNTNNDVGVFLQNAISYSNTIGPVGIGAAYSLPERNTVGAPSGAVYSLGVTYSGPVSLSAAYQSNNKPNTSDRLSSIYTVGASYTMGAFTGKLNFLRGENRDTNLVDISKVNVFGLGVDWKTAANNTVIAAAYFGNDKDRSEAKTNTFLLSDEYALSKRTTLYGQLAYVRADKNASLLTTVVAGGTAADTNTTLLNVGIKHSF
ncbi:porin [Herminiimonas sp. CN]|uniref:porin n=1 Tax=Herminiimonas sp. CN TaxID=1349818 RepID=UPI000473441E|nr:porin [Herminiimonas sp. CN]